MRPLMSVFALTAAAALLGPAAASAQTQITKPQSAPGPAPEPVQVEAWPIARTSEIGTALFIQDRAASRATDVLLARLGGKNPDGLIGWIVVERGRDQLVRFLTGTPEAPKAGYDILVDRNGRPNDRSGAVIETLGADLPQDQLARFNARNTAADNIGALRCAARYNSVVLKDPDSDGWLVWLLAATTEPNKILLTGHYRFHVSADGRTVQKREQLSNSCLDMDRSDATQNGQTIGLFTSIVVAPQPLEIHVFQSLLNRLPIYVMAAATNRIWSVDGARIRDVTPPKPN